MSYLSDVIGHALLVCGLPVLFFCGGWGIMKMHHSLSVLRYHREEEEHKRYMEMMRIELVTPAEGLYPVPRDILMSGEIPSHQMALSLAYLGSKQSSPALSGFALAPDDAKVSVDTPTWGESLSNGAITGGDDILLGYREDGSPLMSTWDGLHSCIVGGFSGSGKSTTMRSLVAQVVMSGGRFGLIDPHVGHSQSLATSLEGVSGSMVCRPAKESHDVLHVLSFFADEFERRRDNGLESEYTLMLVVDEATSLLNRSAIVGELTSGLQQIASEGRKYNMYAIVGCQTLTASSMGGTSDLRDLFPSAFVHRSKLNHARALLQGLPDASNAPHFDTGQCLFYSTDGTTEMLRIPSVTMEDIEALSTRQAVSAPALSQIEQAVKDALIAGWSMNRIISEVFGVESRGTSWNQAADKVRKITSDLVSNLQ